MLTADRPQFVETALRCFSSQTYLDRELLIIDSGIESMDLKLLENCRGNCEYRRVNKWDYPVIGALRNHGCHLAKGEVIAHWDDDDWSAPARLANQIARMESSGKPVTGYRTMKFFDGNSWWLYEGTPLFALGTSLCYRKQFWEKHPFPENSMTGEDFNFTEAAKFEKAIDVTDDDFLMIARVHDGNTSQKAVNQEKNNYKRIDPGSIPPWFRGTVVGMEKTCT